MDTGMDTGTEGETLQCQLSTKGRLLARATALGKSSEFLLFLDSQADKRPSQQWVRSGHAKIGSDRALPDPRRHSPPPEPDLEQTFIAVTSSTRAGRVSHRPWQHSINTRAGGPLATCCDRQRAAATQRELSDIYAALCFAVHFAPSYSNPNTTASDADSLGARP